MSTAGGPPPAEDHHQRQLQVTHGAGEVVLAGDIDWSTLPQLREALRSVEADLEAGLVIDLQQVRSLQSDGVAELYQQAERLPLTLVVTEGSPVATVIDISALEQVAAVELRPPPGPTAPPSQIT